MQEQQLKASQLVLQQQAASAVAAASKTQREVRAHMHTWHHPSDGDDAQQDRVFWGAWQTAVVLGSA